MRKSNRTGAKKELDKKDLKALADWLKSDGQEAFRRSIENKTEVERLIEKMSVIDEKAVKEPYTV